MPSRAVMEQYAAATRKAPLNIAHVRKEIDAQLAN
jgi:hypothetical protein